eukprot:6454881-Amphidinium_carterae.1
MIFGWKIAVGDETLDFEQSFGFLGRFMEMTWAARAAVRLPNNCPIHPFRGCGTLWPTRPCIIGVGPRLRPPFFWGR